MKLFYLPVTASLIVAGERRMPPMAMGYVRIILIGWKPATPTQPENHQPGCLRGYVA